MATTNKILYKYGNGNYTVTIFDDGTKIRETDDDVFMSEFPESIDVKITNNCNLNCKYCHENSTISGSHADLEELKSKLSELPGGVELAIGGGNPLSHPQLFEFLTWLKTNNFIANITVNQKHIVEYDQLIKDILSQDLIKGLGISITSNNFIPLKEICLLSSNVVFHVIAGVNNLSIIPKLMKINNCKILVLGYKTFGRGVDYYSNIIQENILSWQTGLKKYVGECILSFDNLAIEQLKIRNWFTDKGWDMFYMGDDFTHTMYIDAVEQQYAPTSRNSDRKSFADYSLIEYFKKFNESAKLQKEEIG
jgi:hypothetical protein